jgi:conjugative transfer region protein TrbK
MRGRLLNIGAIARAAGFAVIAAAIVATATHLQRDDERPRHPSSSSSLHGDRLAQELARCRALGMAAKDDASCEAAWTENRRRFFTYRQPSKTEPAVTQPPASAPEEK